MRHFFLMILTFCFIVVQAQEKEKKEEKDSTKDEGKEKIEKAIKKSKEFTGLFTIYEDSLKGDLMLKITKDQLGKEFIFFSQIENGTLDAGRFKGAYQSSKIFTIERKFDKIRFIQKNTNYYFDPDSQLAKAKDANISDAILAAIKIEAEHEDTILIKANDLFKKQTFTRIKPNYSPLYKGFKLGNIDKEKTTIESIKSYPDNLNVLTEFVFSSGGSQGSTTGAVTDKRAVAIKVFQMWIAMPENNYKPRMDDPRIGYFLDFVDDQTTSETVNYRDMINRWDLQKKNPKAELSEPITPITWWIENTTPIRFRETIKKGVLEWNKAFEKIGFKNAMVVKVQPDDADWDAGDIRYNVLRWTSSPQPPFGGYGPSFSNPRTGQILGADIMLEYVHHTNRVFYDKLLDESAESRSEEEQHHGHGYTHKHEGHDPKICSYASHLHDNIQLGRALLTSGGKTASDDELSRMQEEALMELVMHEVGHTLGLNHNMKSSTAIRLEDLRNAEWTRNNSLTGSVMDYNDINIHPDKEKQGNYYGTTIGPYDYWAIEFGYKPNISERELTQIAEKSTRPELTFGNDADDMRWPGKGIDPRVMIDDLSDDPVTYAHDKIKIVLSKMENLDKDFFEKGEFFEDYRRAFFVLRGHYWRDLRTISKQIGGIYVERNTMGQSNAKQAYTPVAEAKQRKAMELLAKYAFSPDAFDVPSRLFNNLARQRRGYNFFADNEDPKVHQYVLGGQQSVLSQLLHPNVLRRLVDSEVYGNTYTIDEHFKALNSAIFDADAKGKINKYRQNLQSAYVSRLLNLLNSKYWNRVERTAVFMAIKDVEKKLGRPKANSLSGAHRLLLKEKIDKAAWEKK